MSQMRSELQTKPSTTEVERLLQESEKAQIEEFLHRCVDAWGARDLMPVSYTHLTLPTILLV
eukprot:8222283-Pyramimonas_sp.AAC.1